MKEQKIKCQTQRLDKLKCLELLYKHNPAMREIPYPIKSQRHEAVTLEEMLLEERQKRRNKQINKILTHENS